MQKNPRYNAAQKIVRPTRSSVATYSPKNFISKVGNGNLAGTLAHKATNEEIKLLNTRLTLSEFVATQSSANSFRTNMRLYQAYLATLYIESRS